MNKKGIFKTQSIFYLKATLVLLVVYGAILLVQLFFTNTNSPFITNIEASYLFAGGYFVYSLFNLSEKITFYTFHSYTRSQVIKQTTYIQFLVSLIIGLFLEGMYVVSLHLNMLGLVIKTNYIREQYMAGLTNNEVILFLISSLFLSLIFFLLFQLANLLVVLTYSLSSKQLLTRIVIILVVVLVVLVMSKYISGAILASLLLGFNYLLGVESVGIPNIIVPLVISVVLSGLFFYLSLLKCRHLEIKRISTLS